LFNQNDTQIDKRIDLLNNMYLKKIKPKEEKERIEKERFEKERLEKERLEKERLEKERLEKERLEKERLEKERLEKERLEKEQNIQVQESLEKESLEEIDRKRQEEIDRKRQEEIDRKRQEEIDRKRQEEIDRKRQEEIDRKRLEEIETKTNSSEVKEILGKNKKTTLLRRNSYVEESDTPIWEFCRNNNKKVRIDNIDFNLAVDKLAKGIYSGIIAYSGNLLELANIAKNLTLDLKGSQSSLDSEHKVVGKTSNDQVVFLKIQISNKRRGLNLFKCLSFASSRQILVAKYTIVKPKNSKAREICNNKINKITMNTLEQIFEEDEVEEPDCCGCYK
jgi:hypothetical protein